MSKFYNYSFNNTLLIAMQKPEATYVAGYTSWPVSYTHLDVYKRQVPFKGGHYAAYPPKLVETCLLAGCPEGGIVLDPFMGSGTTGRVAAQKMCIRDRLRKEETVNGICSGPEGS